MKLHQWRTLEALPPLTHPVGKAPHDIWLDVSRHYNLRKLHAAQCVLPTSDGLILHRLTNPIFELIYTSAPPKAPHGNALCAHHVLWAHRGSCAGGCSTGVLPSSTFFMLLMLSYIFITPYLSSFFQSEESSIHKNH